MEVPDDIIEDSTPLREDFIIGKFLSKAPHVGKVHVIVNKIWPLGDKTAKIDAFVVNDLTVKFRIRDRATRTRVIKRHMWNIAGVPMYVSKWAPNVEEEPPTMNSVPLWVVMKNVPHKMYSWEGLGFLASAVGNPKKLHPDTETCKSFEEARVSVIADLSKELPKSFRFKSSKGVDSVVEFSYPWLPERCNSCSKWGHKTEVCSYGGKKTQISKEGTEQIPKGKEDTEREEGEIDMEAVMPEEEPEKVEAFDKHATVTVPDAGDCETEQGEIETALVQTEVMAIESNGEGEWHTVSPSKKGRHDVEQETNENILSASKFSVLAVEEKDDDAVVELTDRNQGDVEGQETQPSGGNENKGNTPNQQKRRARRKPTREENGTRTCLPRVSKSAHKIIHGLSQAVGENGSPLKH